MHSLCLFCTIYVNFRHLWGMCALAALGAWRFGASYFHTTFALVPALDPMYVRCGGTADLTKRDRELSTYAVKACWAPNAIISFKNNYSWGTV